MSLSYTCSLSRSVLNDDIQYFTFLSNVAVGYIVVSAISVDCIVIVSTQVFGFGVKTNEVRGSVEIFSINDIVNGPSPSEFRRTGS